METVVEKEDDILEGRSVEIELLPYYISFLSSTFRSPPSNLEVVLVL